MSGFVIDVECPHCRRWVNVSFDDCPLCGESLTVPPGVVSVDAACDLCGAPMRTVEGDDYPVCHDCVVAAVDGHLDARLATNGGLR